MKPWWKARSDAAYYAHWDDHEFVNDFSREENKFPYSNDGVFQGVNKINGEKLYKRGVRAFRDYNPVNYNKKTGLYRHQRWGKNLEVFFLDERSFRSSSADYNGACDNPAGSGNPDLAPTAPQSVRNVFAAIAPPLANPAPPACLDAINDPDRTMLGNAQLRKFKKDIESSNATFKVIFNEVPIQQFYALPYDRWEGYEAERKKLLRFLKKNVDNAVFLTTDVHANMVNDARFNTLGGPGVKDSGILDITNGPIATENFAGEINSAVGNPAAGALVTQPVLPAAAAGRRRHAVRGDGPVQLRRGRGHQVADDGRPARRSRRPGQEHRRRLAAGAVLLAGRDPGRVGADRTPRVYDPAVPAGRRGNDPPRPPAQPAARSRRGRDSAAEAAPGPCSGSRPRTCAPPASRSAPGSRAAPDRIARGRQPGPHLDCPRHRPPARRRRPPMARRADRPPQPSPLRRADGQARQPRRRPRRSAPPPSRSSPTGR